MGLFSKVSDYRPDVKRNVFDLSFSNNLTTKFGQLTPVCCMETLPGDKFRIKSAFGLRFMPTYFPLQSRIRADVHFFYVRNRNLWEDWPRFITQSSLSDGQNPPIAPFLDYSSTANVCSTGSLGDYLGLPTTIPTNSLPSLHIDFSKDGSTSSFTAESDIIHFENWSQINSQLPLLFDQETGGSVYSVISFDSAYQSSIKAYSSSILGNLTIQFNAPVLSFEDVKLVTLTEANDSCFATYYPLLRSSFVNSPTSSLNKIHSFVFENVPSSSYYCLIFKELSIQGGLSPISLDSSWTITFRPNGGSICSVSELKDFHNPYTYGSLSVSALPFRAYESIYNSFYRDERVDPFKIDGKIHYNKWCTTTDGGKDSTPYKLCYRNWEQDFLTTCVPSPQQGIAPLVGISSSGRMAFAMDDGSTYEVEPVLADDGDTIINAKITDSTPQSVARALVNYASTGISINDFRNVNSLQRWLETNIRRGYKYRDQVISHFGVEPRFDTLDMPEFIGGFSQWIDSNQVNQTSEDSDNPLGSYAGQLSCVGGSKHDINVSCDEHGFIIGILSVVPVPSYSQLMPKFFTKSEALDYFFPEFGHIGMQPITYNEVFPLLSCDTSTDDSNDQAESLAQVFGYQRAWYDYISKTDEIHGDFRTSLRDFILTRTFTSKPYLNSSFTVIDPKQLNDVFSVTLDNDKILGQLYFDVKSIRPIPRYGVPRLE